MLSWGWPDGRMVGGERVAGKRGRRYFDTHYHEETRSIPATIGRPPSMGLARRQCSGCAGSRYPRWDRTKCSSRSMPSASAYGMRKCGTAAGQAVASASRWCPVRTAQDSLRRKARGSGVSASATASTPTSSKIRRAGSTPSTSRIADAAGVKETIPTNPSSSSSERCLTRNTWRVLWNETARDSPGRDLISPLGRPAGRSIDVRFNSKPTFRASSPRAMCGTDP